MALYKQVASTKPLEQLSQSNRGAFWKDILLLRYLFNLTFQSCELHKWNTIYLHHSEVKVETCKTDISKPDQ